LWKPFGAAGKLHILRSQDVKCKFVLCDGAGRVRMNVFVAKDILFQKGRGGGGTIYIYYRLSLQHFGGCYKLI